MSISQYITLLDTCVLAPMPVMDTLLRLAEEPAFYTPKWSAHIIQELRKTLADKFKYSPQQVERRIEAMESTFPSAMVTGYENLIDSMENGAKDRHVLAAAVKCGAHAIVSDNVKDFPRESLAPYGLECLTADQFLKHQYHLKPGRIYQCAGRAGVRYRVVNATIDFQTRPFAVKTHNHSLGAAGKPTQPSRHYRNFSDEYLTPTTWDHYRIAAVVYLFIERNIQSIGRQGRNCRLSRV